MEPLPEDRPPRPEEWSRVEKGAGVAKSAAKKRVSSGTSNSTAVDPAFAVLRKFEERNDDARDGDDAANENAVDLDSYAVSAPFYHAFQDTGARAWCAIVTSASGFDSDPVPITAAVPRMRKIKGTAPAPVLEKEEKREVVEEFRRRQREARKAEKANKPNKPKKKKGKGEEDGEGDENETVSMNGLVLPKTLDVDDANAARILHTLFARAPYEAPAPAREQQYAQQPTQTFTQKQVHAYHHHHHHHQQQQMLARQQQQVQDRQFLQDWSSPGIASQQQQVLEAQSAQMADMQRQLAAALQGQEEAVRIANQAQMAAAHAAAAAASAQASAHRNAGMRKENWRRQRMLSDMRDPKKRARLALANNGVLRLDSREALRLVLERPRRLDSKRPPPRLRLRRLPRSAATVTFRPRFDNSKTEQKDSVAAHRVKVTLIKYTFEISASLTAAKAPCQSPPSPF